MVQTKFIQSVEFRDPEEQTYYDSAREMMRNEGISSMVSMLAMLESLPPGEEISLKDQLKVPKKRFIQILHMAKNDYMDIVMGKLTKNGYVF